MTAGRPLADLPVAALLADLEVTGSLSASCRNVGVCYRTVYRRTRRDPALAARVEQARKAGRDAKFRHGVSTRSCHCDECRFADTLRQREHRAAKNSSPCGHCGRVTGTRGARRYAHFSEPGVVCPGGTSASGSVRPPRSYANSA